ncbi:putative membrane protein; putative channel [Sterolibacterium denitrificans]|uniref:Mechanosensing system component YbdG n=1 Tax=Sterolibacterium denitrificans TaxID=157592 RepID=A0A7Z7HNP7_9PROT|nr:mechanosensitive ion channel domain-containing protein [Sterolibacterium denitrificans]SMB21344.1 putative membrane protein; putative channel [Sterolibacterium denitrificans]
MSIFFERLDHWLGNSPGAHALLFLLGLGLLAWLANWLTKHILLRSLRHLFRLFGIDRNELTPLHVIARLANIIPTVVLMLGIQAVPELPEMLVTVVQNVCSAFIVLTLALAVSGMLTLVNEVYQRRPDAHLRPIKGYIQVLKIAIFIIAAILVVANLIDRSPLILLSGLGAMAAVLMLIFQDTLLSLVASVQLGSNDMVRVGDWIEMPQLNADGSVIDIALHTVKVQNWDKTITTIPTKRLISDSFRNWRGMQESGGRRIKRSLYLDQQSVRFLSEEERQRLKRFSLLSDYLESKEEELANWNARLGKERQEQVNQRRLTNIGTFRHYVERYVRRHPGIHQDMILMVRLLSPTADGLPLELYCFTDTTAWVPYEGIQSDIFDHLLAILPEFGLRVFQHPSGADMRTLRPALAPSPGA